MSTLEQDKAEAFIRSLPETSQVNVRITGYCVTLEELLYASSHLGRTIRIHPGNDTLECCKADLIAMAKDFGIVPLTLR
jgi:hypothetical protein